MIDFLDVSDPSMVNLLYQSVAKLYEKMAKNEYSINYLVEEVEMESGKFTDVTAKRFYEISRRLWRPTSMKIRISQGSTLKKYSD